jgi:hypothetical protein
MVGGYVTIALLDKEQTQEPSEPPRYVPTVVLVSYGILEINNHQCIRIIPFRPVTTAYGACRAYRSQENKPSVYKRHRCKNCEHTTGGSTFLRLSHKRPFLIHFFYQSVSGGFLIHCRCKSRRPRRWEAAIRAHRCAGAHPWARAGWRSSLAALSVMIYHPKQRTKLNSM